jgi:methionyl aminopeptidase
VGKAHTVPGVGWTVVTADRKLSAQYEHTIAVTSGGCEVLIARHVYIREAAQLT